MVNARELWFGPTNFISCPPRFSLIASPPIADPHHALSSIMPRSLSSSSSGRWVDSNCRRRSAKNEFTIHEHFRTGGYPIPVISWGKIKKSTRVPARRPGPPDNCWQSSLSPACEPYFSRHGFGVPPPGLYGRLGASICMRNDIYMCNALERFGLRTPHSAGLIRQ